MLQENPNQRWFSLCMSYDEIKKSTDGLYFFKVINYFSSFLMMNNPRTSLDMDGTLTLIFANSVTTQDIITKISASFQITLEWILTKFEGCGLKSKGATPIRSFLHSWREIQILSTYDLDFLYKAGFHRGWQLVKIWCRYL